MQQQKESDRDDRQRHSDRRPPEQHESDRDDRQCHSDRRPPEQNESDRDDRQRHSDEHHRLLSLPSTPQPCMLMERSHWSTAVGIEINSVMAGVTAPLPTPCSCTGGASHCSHVTHALRGGDVFIPEPAWPALASPRRALPCRCLIDSTYTGQGVLTS